MNEPTVEKLLEDAYRKIESECLAHNQTRFELARLKAENERLRKLNEPVSLDPNQDGN